MGAVSTFDQPEVTPVKIARVLQNEIRQRHRQEICS